MAAYFTENVVKNVLAVSYSKEHTNQRSKVIRVNIDVIHFAIERMF